MQHDAYTVHASGQVQDAYAHNDKLLRHMCCSNNCAQSSRSSAHQQLFDGPVVGDDAIVHNGELVQRVAGVWVGVSGLRRSVGGPARVCNAAVVVQNIILHNLLVL